MTRPRREHHLTRQELLDAALKIVDTEGLAALTMRRLADVVGVEAMSLYHHVPSKDALVDLTLERMRSEMQLPESLPDDWAGLLEAIFVAYRRLLLAHPNMLSLAWRRTDRAATSGLEFLIDRGIEREAAVEMYQSLVAFTIGYSMLSSPSATDWSNLPNELVERVRDWREDTFRRGLRAIMNGYRPEGLGGEAAEQSPARSGQGEVG